MHVLVSGATGFLGAHVVRELLREGHRPRALIRPGSPHAHLQIDGVELASGNLLDERSLHSACRGVEGLVHCAARTGWWSRQNAIQRRVNVEGTAALLRAAHKARVGRIVHVSSVAAVGATRDRRLLDESAVWNLHSLGVHYADSKRAGEERALAAARGGMPIVVVNPSFLLGRRLDGRPPSSLLTRIAAGRQLWTSAGGTSVTEVACVARAILRALEGGRVGERYLLAGHNLEWQELVEAIARATGGRAPRFRLSPSGARVLAAVAGLLDRLRLSRPAFAPELFRSSGWYAWFDSSKARRELGYSPPSLEEILRSSLQPPLSSVTPEG